MTHPSARALRRRPVGAGNLRAFQTVAQLLSFRAAADAMALTQSAVSRQIQALEDEVGVALFRRNTRAVELTTAGVQLLQALEPALERVDAAVRQIRQSAGRRTVSISTWSSFASLWLIPRLDRFQQAHPDIDIRIHATDAHIDLETADVDLALRYALATQVPAHAQRLFGEQLTPVASPALLHRQGSIHRPADLERFALLEAGMAYRAVHMEWLSWQRWLDSQALQQLEPPRWLYFNYAHQIVQAALAGHGVALARMPLVADSLAQGHLVEVLPATRLDSPMVYWLLVGPQARARSETQVFCQWLQDEAHATNLMPFVPSDQ